MKDRPCAIVLIVKSESDYQKVMVAPITHMPLTNPEIAIEIPPKVKQHLGLDSDRSWIILDDFNEFVWPGYDLRPIPAKGACFLPSALFKQMVGKIIELRQKGLVVMPRD